MLIKIKRMARALGQVASLFASLCVPPGLTIVAVVGIGLFVGVTLDLQCGSGPLFTLIALAICVPVSFYLAARFVVRAARLFREGNGE